MVQQPPLALLCLELLLLLPLLLQEARLPLLCLHATQLSYIQLPRLPNVQKVNVSQVNVYEQEAPGHAQNDPLNHLSSIRMICSGCVCL